MWSAVPDFGDLSSDSETEEVKLGDFTDESDDHRRLCGASNAAFDSSETAPPRGVAQQHWQTFSKLKRRRTESSKSKDSTRHGIKKQRIKNSDQKDASLSCPPGPSSSNLKETDDGDSSTTKQNKGVDSQSEEKAPSQEHQEHWNTLKRHLNVNEHIQQGIDHGQYNPNKSGLEKQLDQAVKEGKFEEAEDLSDQLAKRDLACKIAKSADARDYLKWKESEETKRKSKRKKKKLNWGFEAKERWQMKGNM
ncbi:uncharacterized protein [Asterias amurensis]|uniref:uncharacterized protein isoform X2 n=1 Tax=Asterias amurensis TaxID=7602 RepID=UPI003AB3DCA1